MFLEAVGTHAVGSFGGEPGFEIFFHVQPFVVVADFAAPTANAEKFFEVMQSLQQFSGGQMDPCPNQEHNDGAEGGAVPIGSERFAEHKVWYARQLGELGKRDDQREAKRFNPKNSVRVTLGAVHPKLLSMWRAGASTKSAVDVANGAGAFYLLAAMIRLVLFDIDGTLVRTGGAGVKAFAKVFETEFNARDGFEKLKFAGRTDVSLVREFFQYHGIAETAENFKRFFERYVFWLDYVLNHSATEACPGVWEFLSGLKEVDNPPLTGLLTGNIRLGAEIKLRHFDLWEEFETGAFADDSEERDQIAAVARERGRRLLGDGLQDEEILVIGDTPLDIRCGRAIGARVLAVATGGATLEELQRHEPDWAVKDLRDVVRGSDWLNKLNG